MQGVLKSPRIDKLPATSGYLTFCYLSAEPKTQLDFPIPFQLEWSFRGLRVFITSANFTEAALDRNIEMGMLLRDRAMAASVTSHFRGLIDRNLLKPLPAA